MGIDFGDTLPGVAVEVLVRTTVLLAVAAVVAMFLRRASAAYRHLVWTLALASVLVCPLVSRVALPWSAPVPLPVAVPTAPVPVSPALAPATGIEETLPVAAPRAAGPAPVRAVPWGTIMGCAWLCGAALLLGRLLLATRRVRRLYDRSAVPAGEVGKAVEMVLARYPTPRMGRITVRVAPADSPASAPMTWGWHRPVVLLPASASQWPTEQVQSVLLHEIGHIRRADWLVQMGITLTCALYWWHPLVWWAARQAREESERASDDFVLNAGVAPVDYAAHLVSVVRGVRRGAGYPDAAVAMATAGGMERRVRVMLSAGIDRRPVSRRNLAIGGGIALLLLGGFAGLHPMTGTAALPDARNPLSFYYLSRVECMADRNRPLQLERVGISRGGAPLYRFTDKRTGKTFRDGAAVLTEFAALAEAGKTPRSGTVAYPVPAVFHGATKQGTVYLTPSQLQVAENLRSEARAWQGFLKASPRILSSADIEPNAIVLPSVRRPGDRSIPQVQLTLTLEGAKKLERFTRAHRNEILCMVGDPDQPGSQILMAPNINEALTSRQLVLSFFPTPDGAKQFANRLNAR